MLSLNDREWKTFTVGDLFSVTRPDARTKDAYNEGDVPFVASGAMNNGAAKYCEPRKGEKLDRRGCITVSPVDGSCFYQPIDFLGRGGGGSSIMLLRSEKINGFNGRFVARMLMQTLSAKYTYGRMGNSKTVVRERFMLPIDAAEPDWQFMEDYIREREIMQVERCRDFLKHRLDEIERERERVGAPLPRLSEKTWMPFALSSIGRISSGMDIYTQEREPGRIPYITSGSANNGIGYFVDNTNKTIDSGYVALNRNGAVGKAFYHPYMSLMGNDCRKLHVTAADHNPYVGNFIALAISFQSKCFSYSRKLGTARAKTLKVMLPVDRDDEPDWAYMDAYVRGLMVLDVKRGREYLDRRLTDSF